MYVRSAGLQGREARNQFREIGRPGAFETQPFPIRRMLEPQKECMQCLARELPNGRESLFLPRCFRARDMARATVGRIADQRVAEMREMHTDLMRAAGFEPALKKARKRPFGIAEALKDTVVRSRVFSAAAQDRHALAVERIAPDVAFDHAFVQSRRAPHDGMIGALDGVMLELAGQTVHRAIILRGDEKAAGILVETMHDSRPRFAAEARER